MSMATTTTPSTSDFWSPDAYNTFRKHRARPFHDLLAQVRADPDTVVDLGCGPGDFTSSLADKWPRARIQGIDHSPSMIASAQDRLSANRLWFEVGDIRTWSPTEPVDVVICNVALQWVPGHLQALPTIVESLSTTGWFAFQVPGRAHLDAPCYRLLYETAEDPRWRDLLARPLAERPWVADSADYVDRLANLGCSVDAWETQYYFVLDGHDAVLSWMMGTAARPLVTALPDGHRRQFVDRYRRALAQAYPQRSYGTVFPQHRLSVVVRPPLQPSTGS